jgi:hypothetical protein
MCYENWWLSPSFTIIGSSSVKKVFKLVVVWFCYSLLCYTKSLLEITGIAGLHVKMLFNTLKNEFLQTPLGFADRVYLYFI